MLISMLSAIVTGTLYDGTAVPCALLMGCACVLAWYSARLASRGALVAD